MQIGEDYLVLFEDTSYPDGYSPPLSVAQRYVIMCKEEKKKWNHVIAFTSSEVLVYEMQICTASAITLAFP